MKFHYVSLFSGAGGLDIGLERAGLKTAFLCEIEKVFCNTLESNQGWKHCDKNVYFKFAKIINSNIYEINPKILFTYKTFDLVVGGPPCQAFSSSGKQLSILDPRGVLVAEFCRIVDVLKPKMFLFENVRGLITARDRTGEPGGVITELIHILEKIGYSCRTGLLNSADYGAYQRRVRCFIIGSKKGEAPNFPEPVFQKNNILLEKNWRSLESFLSMYADSNEINFIYPSQALMERLQNIPDGSGVKNLGKKEATRPSGHWGYQQGTFIADTSLPARTVTGSTSQDWIRWKGILRRLTFNEIKLLQGFPEDWIIKGTKVQQYKQIGNAVPIVFGEILGKIIISHLNNFPIGKPIHIEIPKSFKEYIEYTKRDHARNKDTRTVHYPFEQ